MYLCDVRHLPRRSSLWRCSHYMRARLLKIRIWRLRGMRSYSTRMDHQFYCDVGFLAARVTPRGDAQPHHLLHRPLVQRIARTQLLRRDLSSFELVALIIDGVHFAEHVVLAALGIREHPQKHLLGLKEGATENAAACKAGAARRRLQG